MVKKRSKTVRQDLISHLESEEMSVRELSKAVGVQEKEIYEHFSHIHKTLKAQKKKLVSSPYRCLKCSYTFNNRKRLNRPGRCPLCKESFIEPATYRILDRNK